ncbi:MAG: hypothetical protein HY223_04285 [Thaumarchaeota archaeon]|nr:hypothetical protein [Nitrososphaerota archaeon]
MATNVDQARKALVVFSVEKSLLEAGVIKLLETASNLLYENHRLYLSDCYEHPRHLNETLGKINTNTCATIKRMITSRLREFYHIKPISEFLEGMDIILTS